MSRRPPIAGTTRKPRSKTVRLVEPGDAAAEESRKPWWVRYLRPKGNLSKTELRVLGALAIVPLLVMLVRIMALPGVLGPGFHGPMIDVLRTIGSSLTQAFSLTSVPAAERDRVLYLLFVPTCALFVALARLTFGIRVLGFRSILIAVGFHECGIVPSLFLIAAVVLTIVLVRPWLKRIRLPLYARVSVILCIVAMTMVAAILAAPWMRSDILWGVVYFPVIVLGMLAEGIARTLNHDSMLSASWRALTTVLLAFLLAILGQVPALRAVLLQFPELLLTQIVAIVLISEFLDFRLFQDWDSKVAGMALPKLLSDAGAYRVAVVRNSADAGVIGRSGIPSPKKRGLGSVQGIVDALREGGHTVRVLEGDTSLLNELRRFMPPNPRTGQPGGIVFNLAHGIQGEAPYTHVPAMLEMSGIAYTGAAPLGHALTLDRFVAKTLMQQAGVLTPAFCLMASAKDDSGNLHYPLVVKPRHESSYELTIVEDRPQLENAVKGVLRRYRQAAVVEEYIAGRQMSVALLGNDPIECMPLVEIVAGRRDKICPAPTDEVLAKQIRRSARATFRACGCRDYARVDLRVGELGNPYVIEINTIGILSRGGAFVQAGEQAGYPFAQLVCRIVEVARTRYLAREPVRRVDAPPQSDIGAEALRSKVSPLH
jgi:D-alanine-D-alanine ligase